MTDVSERPAIDDWPLLCDEFHQVRDGDEIRFAHIRVTTDKPLAGHARLGPRLAETLRAVRQEAYTP